MAGLSEGWHALWGHLPCNCLSILREVTDMQAIHQEGAGCASGEKQLWIFDIGVMDSLKANQGRVMMAAWKLSLLILHRLTGDHRSWCWMKELMRQLDRNWWPDRTIMLSQCFLIGKVTVSEGLDVCLAWPANPAYSIRYIYQILWQSWLMAPTVSCT